MAVLAEKKRARDEKREGFLTLLEQFTAGKKGPVLAERNLDGYFDWDEITELTQKLLDADFAIVVAKGYYCVEIPLEGGRAPGVYCGDLEALDKYEKAGFIVIDMQKKD